MLLSCIFSIVALQEPVITIPAGYYTVAELADQLNHQQVKAKVVSAAGDLYALRITSKAWKDVRAALVADGRLVISHKDGVWQIERSIVDKNGEALALKRYLDAARQRVHAVFNGAAEGIRRVEALPKEQRNAAYDAYPPSNIKDDPVRTGVNSLVYLVGASKDQAFLTVSGPAALSDPKRPVPFAHFRLWTLGEAAHMLSPEGTLDNFRLPFLDWQRATPEERERAAREIQVGVKLPVDPLTLTIGSRAAMSMPPSLGGMAVGLWTPSVVSPRHARQTLRPEDVWDTRYLQEQEVRQQNSAASLQSLPNTEIELQGRLARPSELLLRLADKGNMDLVCHVGAFTDMPTQLREKATIKQLFEDVNAARFDEFWLKTSANERVSPNLAMGKQLPLNPKVRISLRLVGGAFVVRDEMRFLDGLSVSPNGPPTAIENARMAGKKPSLLDVATHVAGLNIGKWPTSVFSSNYLQTCNPISFYPFARALLASDLMRKGVAAGKSFDIDASKMEPAAHGALVQAIKDARLLNDAVHNGQLDPVSALAMMKASAKIVVLIEGDRYEFRLFGPAGESLLWTSWVRLK